MYIFDFYKNLKRKMKTGICELSYIPMRAGLSHKTEMINLVLFGEIFEVLITRNEWVKIRLLHDDYEGWVEESSIIHISEDSGIVELFADYIVCPEANTILTRNAKETITIPSGSKIPATAIKSGEFSINSNKYKLPETFVIPENKDSHQTIVNYARNMLNTAYLWGGRTAWGIDCSGFSQYLYSLVGIKLPRDASQQVNMGNTLNFITEAQPGDLAFFDNEEGNIIHVGIICDHGKIIHASGKVKIDTIDHHGIYNKTQKRYTHNLRVIQAIL